MVIKSSNYYVGIGTSAPVGQLDIYNAGADYTNSLVVRTPWAGITMDNTQISGGRKWHLFTGGPSAGIGRGNFGIFDGTASAYRFSITSAGLVTINNILDLGNSGELRITPNASGTVPLIQSMLNHLTLNISNNVGIGLYNPAYKLDVNGTFRVSSNSYYGDWLRITNNNTGIWWENLGRGIRSPDAEGNSYGNISTHGDGRNNWRGYGLDSRYCFMKYAFSSDWGIHDNNWSWLIKGDGLSDRKIYISGQAVLISRNWDIFMVHMNLENTGSGYFYVNQGAGYGIASDSRIKRNIEEISSAKSIAFIKGLKPSSFCMKNTCITKQKTADGKEIEYEESEFCCCAQEGFIAQNVLESAIKANISKHVCNHWYEYEEEMKKPVEDQTLTDKNTLGVNDRPILSHTVNAVKGLMEQIDVLVERNKLLEAHARKLESDFSEYRERTETRLDKIALILSSLMK
jgi:uncharacterized protein YacL (UPF0231 family)